jgi:hypothetical protein
VSDSERILHQKMLDEAFVELGRDEIEEEAKEWYLEELGAYDKKPHQPITLKKLDMVRNRSNEYLKLRGSDAFRPATAAYFADAASLAVLRWIRQGCAESTTSEDNYGTE